MRAVYCGYTERQQVICIKSREELFSYLWRSFNATVGDEALAKELEATYFTVYKK